MYRSSIVVRQYRFSDIKEVRINQDSWTLILTNGKVHIESMVCMSETLYNKIEAAINKTGDRSMS